MYEILHMLDSYRCHRQGFYENKITFAAMGLEIRRVSKFLKLLRGIKMRQTQQYIDKILELKDKFEFAPHRKSHSRSVRPRKRKSSFEKMLSKLRVSKCVL